MVNLEYWYLQVFTDWVSLYSSHSTMVKKVLSELKENQTTLQIQYISVCTGLFVSYERLTITFNSILQNASALVL